MARLVFAPAAQRDYKKLPADTREDIKKLLDGVFANNPLSPVLNVRKLQSPLVGYRLRKGDWRILFTFEEGTVYVYKIRNRKDAYQ